MTKQLQPKERKAQILAKAVELARRIGYQNVTRQGIADALGVSPPLVNRYFDTMVKLKRAILGEAIRTSDLGIIAQGIAAKEKRMLNLPEELQRRALASLVK